MRISPVWAVVERLTTSAAPLATVYQFELSVECSTVKVTAFEPEALVAAEKRTRATRPRRGVPALRSAAAPLKDAVLVTLAWRTRLLSAAMDGYLLRSYESVVPVRRSQGLSCSNCTM